VRVNKNEVETAEERSVPRIVPSQSVPQAKFHEPGSGFPSPKFESVQFKAIIIYLSDITTLKCMHVCMH
jgi:hypothetical protein